MDNVLGSFISYYDFKKKVTALNLKKKIYLHTHTACHKHKKIEGLVYILFFLLHIRGRGVVEF